MNHRLRAAVHFVVPIVCLCGITLTSCGSRSTVLRAIPSVLEQQVDTVQQDTSEIEQPEAHVLRTCITNKAASEPTVDCYLPQLSGRIDHRWSVGFADQEDLKNPADHGGADATCGPITFAYVVATGDATSVTVSGIPTISQCPITAPKAAPGAPAVITTSAQVRAGTSPKPQAITVEWTGSSTVTDPSDGFNGSPTTFNFRLIVHVGSPVPKTSSSEDVSGVRNPLTGTIGGGGGGGTVTGSDFFTVTPLDGPKQQTCTCNQQQIANAAKKYNVDPYFIAAIASRESGGDTNCNSQDPVGYGKKSPKYGQHHDGHGYGVMGIDDRWHTNAEGNYKQDAQANIDVGTNQLARLLKQYGGSQLKAAHDYNAGNPLNASNPADYDLIVIKNEQRLVANHFFQCERKSGAQAFVGVVQEVVAYLTRHALGQETACSSRVS